MRDSEKPRVVVVASAYRPEERSHLSGTLATTLVQMNVRLLLVDLDATGRVTRQVFGPRLQTRKPANGPILGPARTDEFLKLTLKLFRGRFFVRRAYLYARPGRTDLRRFEEQAESALERPFREFITSLNDKFEIVLVDSPQLPSHLTHVAARSADLVVAPIVAGLACDAEARAIVDALLKLGVAPKRIAVLFTSAGNVEHLAEELTRTIDTLGKEFEQRRVGRILTSRIRHDVRVLGAHGVEYDTREDWIRLAAELRARLEDLEERAWPVQLEGE
jgi:cellulose biosynthesis protein BcsQ